MTPPTDKLAEAKKLECPCTHHRLVHECLPNHQYGPCRQCPCAGFGRNEAIPSIITKVETQEVWNEADFREDFKQMWNNDEKLHDFQNAMVYVIKGVMEKQALISYEKGREEQRKVDAGIVKTEMGELYDSLEDGELFSIPDYSHQLQEKILNHPNL